MYLIDILKEKSKEDLKNFARTNEIAGYSDLKKDELVQLILTAVNDAERLKGMFTRLSPSAKWILMILTLDFNGVSRLDVLEQAVQQQYSRKTFRKAIGMLLESPFFGLEFTPEDVGIGFIPDGMKAEVHTLAEQYAKRHRKEEGSDLELMNGTPEEIAAVLEEKEEEKEIVSNVPISLLPLVELLNYTDKNTLKFYCEEHGLVKGGNRQQLIERILNSDLNLEELFDTLFSTPELQMMAKDLHLSKIGKKAEIIQRILEAFSLFSAKLATSFEPKPDKPTPEPEGSRKEVVKEEEIKHPTNPEKIEILRKDSNNLEKQIEELLEELGHTKRPKPRDEKEFQFFMLGYLYGKYGSGHRNVTYERAVQGQRFDITLWGKIIIETKVTASKRDVKDGLGQLLDYLEQNKQYTHGILAVYDESTERNLNSQFSHKYADKIYVDFFT